MEHIGIGHDDAAGLTNLASLPAWRVAVVPVNGNRQISGPDDGRSFGKLVMGQRLRRKQIQRLRPCICQQSLQHGDGIGQGFARSGRRRHYNILAGDDSINRAGLVRIKLSNSAFV